MITSGQETTKSLTPQEEDVGGETTTIVTRRTNCPLITMTTNPSPHALLPVGAGVAVEEEMAEEGEEEEEGGEKQEEEKGNTGKEITSIPPTTMISIILIANLIGKMSCLMIIK